jgi:hypothetical protein
MKKVIQHFVLALLIYGCAGEEVKTLHEADTREQFDHDITNTSWDEYISNIADARAIQPNRPRQTISLRRAHEMYQAYQPRFNAIKDFRGGLEDARYGWHSLDFYKNYIAYLEYLSASVNIPVSGLRFYYVAYPQDQISGAQSGYQTYIFAPTYYDRKKNLHIAFDPLHSAYGKPRSIHEIITQTGDPNNTFGNSSSVANLAQMCRPNCPE